MKKDYREHKKLQGGPGGWRCACCNPYGRSPRKMKANARRLVRRVTKQKIQVEE